jgi:phosphoribosylglycinamide formyltransferase 1
LAGIQTQIFLSLTIEKMKIGVICSAGGSSFLEVARICNHIDFFVLTDRACGVEYGCKELGIPYQRIEESSNELFSQKAVEILSQQGEIDFVVMFFSRLVTNPILSTYSLLNIHPSLLPAFKGIGALKKAKNCNAKFFGATLHIANEYMDDGLIVAQVCQPLPYTASLDFLNKSSFIQKAILFLLAIDLYENNFIFSKNSLISSANILSFTNSLNPSFINSKYIQAIQDIQNREDIIVMQIP